MRKGITTQVPGLSWDEKTETWVLRAKVKDGSLTSEKTKRVKGTKREALLALELLREEARVDLQRRRDGVEQHEAMTLGVYAPLWLKSLGARAKSRSYLESRAFVLERFILERLGMSTLQKLKPRELMTWQEWLADQRQPDALRGRNGSVRKNPRGGQPYAHETLLTAWATLKAFLSWVALQENVVSPVLGLRLDVKGAEATEKEVVSAGELRLLLENSDEETLDIQVMLVVGFALGLRFCELSALHWDDLDLDAGTLKLRRSQVKGRVGPPKTKATRRTMVVPSEVVDVLKEHREWARTQKGGDVLVFPSRVGTYRYPSVLTAPLARCCAKAGIEKHLTAHCLRHTTNDLLRRVASDVVVKAMIGHATGSQMTKRYSHVDDEEKTRAQKLAFGDALKAAVPPAKWDRSHSATEVPPV